MVCFGSSGVFPVLTKRGLFKLLPLVALSLTKVKAPGTQGGRLAEKTLQTGVELSGTVDSTGSEVTLQVVTFSALHNLLGCKGFVVGWLLWCF